MEPQMFREELIKYSNDNDTDIIAYVGAINRKGYDRLCAVIPKVARKNCLLILCTYGGSPDAGYRIARALSHHYPKDGKVSILIPSYCKSAGTLICAGAHTLIFSDQGELGPLDVQMRKQDELIEQSSTLDLIRGVTYLYEGVLDSFRRYLLDVNHGTRMSTRTASDIASRLAIGIHEPIFAQIDPQRIGEMQAAMMIAISYAERLDERFKNLKVGAIERLANQYPSHGFVIDRREAREIFNRVERPSIILDCVGAKYSSIFARLDQLQVVVEDVLMKALPQSSLGEQNEGVTDATSQNTDASATPKSGKSSRSSKSRSRRKNSNKSS